MESSVMFYIHRRPSMELDLADPWSGVVEGHCRTHELLLQGSFPRDQLLQPLPLFFVKGYAAGCVGPVAARLRGPIFGHAVCRDRSLRSISPRWSAPCWSA